MLKMPRSKFSTIFSNGGIGLLVLFQLLLELLVPETKMPGFSEHLVTVCVADPDPYVFGPPGSHPDPLVTSTDLASDP